MKRLLFTAIVLFAARAHSEVCPGADDEPALKVKTAAGPSIVVCGQEDRELEGEAGRAKDKKTFSEFTVYSWLKDAKEPSRVFSSENTDTYWAKPVANKSLELEELWFFDEKPQPAIARSVTCTATACEISAPKCVFKMKRNRYPKALAEMKKLGKTPSERGEELLEQIWAQALTGDKAAQDFFAHPPMNLNEELAEDFGIFKLKLQQAKDLKCPSLASK